MKTMRLRFFILFQKNTKQIKSVYLQVVQCLKDNDIWVQGQLGQRMEVCCIVGQVFAIRVEAWVHKLQGPHNFPLEVHSYLDNQMKLFFSRRGQGINPRPNPVFLRFFRVKKKIFVLPLFSVLVTHVYMNLQHNNTYMH